VDDLVHILGKLLEPSALEPEQRRGQLARDGLDPGRIAVGAGTEQVAASPSLEARMIVTMRRRPRSRSR
jgi:hypothetical protein